LINLDFADVKTIMSGMGLAMMGTGVAEGPDRAIEAARRAISSPLLEGASVNGARGVIINVTGGPDLSLVEVSEASSIVQEAADEDANIIFGAVVDPSLKGKVKITVIATGFGPAVAVRPASTTGAHTPVDMSLYAEHTRIRADSAAEAAATTAATAASPRLSIARRPLLDLPMSAIGSGGAAAPTAGATGFPTPPASPAATGAAGSTLASAGGAMTLAEPSMGLDEMRKLELEPDFDPGSNFDVPAFLRRQEM
jgi:cell division protein FtsZ